MPLDLLFPVWQLTIGGCLVVVMVLSIRRLASRGRSRMSRGLVVTGVAFLGLTAVGILLASR